VVEKTGGKESVWMIENQEKMNISTEESPNRGLHPWFTESGKGRTERWKRGD